MKLKKYSFNILDIIIILIFLSVAVSFFFTSHKQEINMLLEKSNDAYISVNITECPDVNLNDFTRGDKIYLARNERLAGKIIKVVNIQEKKYSVSGDGIVFDYGNNNIGVQITFEAKIKKDSTGYYLNGSDFVSPGSKIEILTKDDKILTAIIDDITIKN